MLLPKVGGTMRQTPAGVYAATSTAALTGDDCLLSVASQQYEEEAATSTKAVESGVEPSGFPQVALRLPV